MITPHGPIVATEIADGAVIAAKIGALAVTQAKMNVFISTEQTGTGSEQDVTHTLGVIPAFVFVALTEFGTAENPNITEGTHTDAVVKVAVATSAVKFKVIALAP